MRTSEKLRNHLLIALSFLTFAGVIVVLVSVFFFRKVHEIYNISNSFHSIYEHYSNAINDEQNIMFQETHTSEFDEVEEYHHLENFKKHLTEIHKRIEGLSAAQSYQDFEISQEVDKLNNEISKYETLFKLVLQKTQVEDYNGFESALKIKKYTRDLEFNAEKIGINNIFQIQKIEKEFLADKDELYVLQLGNKIQDLNDEIWKNKKLKMNEKATLVKLLHDYQYAFEELANVNRVLSLEGTQDFKGPLLKSKEMINRQFSIIDQKFTNKEQSLVNNIENGFILAVLNIVAITVFILLMYMKKPVKKAEDEIEWVKERSPKVREEIYEFA